MTTKILRCSCKHAGQDILYGNGQRVHNQCEKSTKWRCVVCLTLHDDQADKVQPTSEAKKSKSKKKGKAEKKK